MNNENLMRLDAEHQDSWALLPWLANDTLRASEKLRVAQHLRTCLVCRREVAMLRRLAEHISTRAPVDECEAALRRLSPRLDAAPRRARSLPWAAAAMLVLCTSLVAWAADNAARSTAWLRHAGYSVVAAQLHDEPVSGAVGPQVKLVFYDDITEHELRSLLLRVGAAVVEGPTPQGVYTLAFARQMSPGEVMDALRQLRFSREVLFAEPAVATRVASRALSW